MAVNTEKIAGLMHQLLVELNPMMITSFVAGSFHYSAATPEEFLGLIGSRSS